MPKPLLDVVCLGEALVDFLPDGRGKRVREVSRWTPCLGGAPANVAVGVARLGGHSALVGVTGEDEFGHFLKAGLAREGVDVSGLRQTAEGKTGLGFVSLTNQGERSFSFYRTRAAETFLGATDTRSAEAGFSRTAVLHVGTNSLVQPLAREAVVGTVARARKAGLITSCDPNLRLHVWPDPAVLKGLLDTLLCDCAVVKLSDEEIAFVTGTTHVEEALRALEARGVILAVVTRGSEGASLRFQGHTLEVPAPKVRVVDTTGAGDGFTAGLLYGLSRLCRTRAELQGLPLSHLEASARLGVAVGSRAVTRLGAVAALPRAPQVARLLKAVAARPPGQRRRARG